MCFMRPFHVFVLVSITELGFVNNCCCGKSLLLDWLVRGPFRARHSVHGAFSSRKREWATSFIQKKRLWRSSGLWNIFLSRCYVTISDTSVLNLFLCEIKRFCDMACWTTSASSGVVKSNCDSWRFNFHENEVAHSFFHCKRHCNRLLYFVQLRG